MSFTLTSKRKETKAVGDTRRKISSAARDRLLVQVGHRCVRCLSDTPEVDIHHIIPLTEGGTNSDENLVVLCPTCHRVAHRYKLGARQLREYKRRAIEGRQSRLRLVGSSWTIPDGDHGPHLYPATELLLTLQQMAEGWYNQLIEAAAVSMTGGIRADITEFEYTHSRYFLPHILAIRNELSTREECLAIVSDVDVLLSLLTDVEVAEFGGT